MAIPALGTFDRSDKSGPCATMQEAERYIQEIRATLPGTPLEKTIGVFSTPAGNVLGYPDDCGKSLRVMAFIVPVDAPDGKRESFGGIE